MATQYLNYPAPPCHRQALAIHWAEMDYPVVLDLALAADLTTSGATYLWLADRLKVPPVTFDARLSKAAAEALQL